MKHLILMAKGTNYNDDKIAIISTEYPFNTVNMYEKAGYKIMIETLITDTKVIL